LKILMTSTSYPENLEDWRGRFIANLVSGLARRNDLTLSLWAPPGSMPASVSDASTPADKAWLQNLARNGGIAHLLRRHPLKAVHAAAGLLGRLHTVYRTRQTDIAHVNWLQNALPLWGTRTAIIISVLGTDFGLLRLPGMKTLLRTVFKQRPTILAPNAEWMVPELQRAFGDVAYVQAVPFGVDDSWFALQRDLPSDGTSNWLAVTRITRAKIGNLFEWGAGLFNEHRRLHLFGPMQETMALPEWVDYHGPAHPSELISTWFPMAHGLVTLSRHDEGRPQVMLEAMAAGLPVIASDLPAHRNFIDDRRTGCLVQSAAAFAEALQSLEQAERNAAMGNAAREWARTTIGNWDDCAARYAALYQRLLEHR
jgi:glycosyltransferase involved in cell wall biosynthesis